ncbi:MAG: type II toxin-antitoxin system RelB/DinJ family antitoxin [Bacteroidales bacterium]|nr:type II toxin-antitoxin system RelB/DinJ family antitoxin [Bacteroidales bacterium]
MSQAVMTVRIEPDKKKKFEMLCKDFGMSANTAFTVFVNSVIRNQSIPFVISTKKEDAVAARGMRAFEALRENAKDSGATGMSLKEINKEIKAAREGR